jgi:hypothetical protein
MRLLTAQVNGLGAQPEDGVRPIGAPGRCPRARVTRVVGWPQPFTIIEYYPGSDDDEDLYFL